MVLFEFARLGKPLPAAFLESGFASELTCFVVCRSCLSELVDVSCFRSRLVSSCRATLWVVTYYSMVNCCCFCWFWR